MCQRIPWKQYGLIVTIAGAPWARTAWKKCNSKIIPRWGLHFLRLWYSWIWRTSARTNKNYKKNYQSSDGGPYVQGHQDAHKWRPHHIGDIWTTRFSYLSHIVTKCTFLTICFIWGGGEGKPGACYVQCLLETHNRSYIISQFCAEVQSH